MSFVHLRTHSEYSVVDGMLRIDDAAQAARADGQVALAITDLNNLFGAVQFYKACRDQGVKPILGHTLAASAALELIICLLALRDGVIPPTINYREADPDCDLDYVTEGARAKPLHTCLSNSFGFGGSNAVLVIKQYAHEPEDRHGSGNGKSPADCL